MKSVSTLYLRISILLFGFFILILCMFLVYAGLFGSGPTLYRVLFVGMLIPAVPFFIGVHQTLRLLSDIEGSRVYSDSSLSALGHIKYCALIISILYAFGMPLIFFIADKDDAPGVVLLGLIFTFVPLIVAVLASLFQNLLQSAISIKLDNAQTV